MQEGLEVQLNKALDGGKWSASRSGRFTQRRKIPLSNGLAAGCTRLSDLPLWRNEMSLPAQGKAPQKPGPQVVMALSYTG